MLEVIGASQGVNDCDFLVKIANTDGTTLAEVWGERNARLYSEAEAMYDLLCRLLPDNPEAAAIIDRVENSPELTFLGLTKEEMINTVKGR